MAENILHNHTFISTWFEYVKLIHFLDFFKYFQNISPTFKWRNRQSDAPESDRKRWRITHAIFVLHPHTEFIITEWFQIMDITGTASNSCNTNPELLSHASHRNFVSIPNCHSTSYLLNTI